MTDLQGQKMNHKGESMGKYPDRETAEELLREAEGRNPGPWGNHSRTAAHCAEAIARYGGMNPDKAYVLGLLHDIGRRFGKRHLGHVLIFAGAEFVELFDGFKPFGRHFGALGPDGFSVGTELEFKLLLFVLRFRNMHCF